MLMSALLDSSIFGSVSRAPIMYQLGVHLKIIFNKILNIKVRSRELQKFIKSLANILLNPSFCPKLESSRVKTKLVSG